MSKSIKFGDMLAGGGGTSTGAYSVPGLNVVWAINHDPVAIETHRANHPETIHFVDDIYDPQLLNKLEPVDALWASLECTQHSKAKGGREKEVGSFMMGWELLRYLPALDPAMLIIENVPEFIKWGPLEQGKRVKDLQGREYIRWSNAIQDLGYTSHTYAMLNAADYGVPSRRVRYIGYFAKPGCKITLPTQTHHKEEKNIYGLPKWKSCKHYIDLQKEGNSIFGRSENEAIAPHQRKPLSPNTLRRIAGGIKKFAPDIYFILKYYGTGDNVSSVEGPLHTIPTHENHALVKMEKINFLSDHCWLDNYNSLDEPINTIMTRQTKEFITLENKFISRWFSAPCANQSLDKPYPTITTAGADQLASVNCQFLSAQYNSNGKPEANNHSIENPAPTIATEEKIQFITAYFNAGGHPESQNQSIENPLNSITTTPNKQALITAIKNGWLDFDIKMRFLDPDELAAIMTFPAGYFDHPELKLSKKKKVHLIGNSVPPLFAHHIINPNIRNIESYKSMINIKAS